MRALRGQIGYIVVRADSDVMMSPPVFRTASEARASRDEMIEQMDWFNKRNLKVQKVLVVPFNDF